MDNLEIKKKVIDLRKKGNTFTEIQEQLKVIIPKSTMSCWCKNIVLPDQYYKRIEIINNRNREKGRKIAMILNKVKREKYIDSVKSRVLYLSEKIKDKDTAKIALAMLYLGEGAKTKRGCLMFGNSNPSIISLFLKLLRYCYNIDERKFRCTFQGRADQNIKQLEEFWSKITKIPLSQFYKANIDPRTIGKPSKKMDYKGVCRIDYFSGDVFLEIMKIIEVLEK